MAKLVNLQANTIGEIARFNSNTIPVFRKYGIDFYCKGMNSLSEACAASGSNQSIVSAELQSALNTAMSENQDLNAWSIDKLIAHIVDSHHHYVNTMVPTISALFKTVLESNETNNLELKRISELFRQLGNDMKQHMQKEEVALFPFIQKLEMSQHSGEELPAGLSVKSLITVIEFEHDTSGIIIRQINQLSNNYTAPEDASPLFCTLFNKLREFESDLILHIHDENNVLHPKAIEQQQALLVHCD